MCGNDEAEIKFFWMQHRKLLAVVFAQKEIPEQMNDQKKHRHHQIKCDDYLSNDENYFQNQKKDVHELFAI